jgi:hypothetical protein
MQNFPGVTTDEKTLEIKTEPTT